jgi:hypothetical protein
LDIAAISISLLIIFVGLNFDSFIRLVNNNMFIVCLFIGVSYFFNNVYGLCSLPLMKDASVNHHLLCSKLSDQFDFTTSAVRLIMSYLSDRSQCVHADGTLSDVLATTSGPRLCSWSPAIFHVHQWNRFTIYIMPCSSLCRRRPTIHQLWATIHQKLYTQLEYGSWQNLWVVYRKPEKITSFAN